MSAVQTFRANTRRIEIRKTFVSVEPAWLKVEKSGFTVVLLSLGSCEALVKIVFRLLYGVVN